MDKRQRQQGGCDTRVPLLASAMGFLSWHDRPAMARVSKVWQATLARSEACPQELDLARVTPPASLCATLRPRCVRFPLLPFLEAETEQSYIEALGAIESVRELHLCGDGEDVSAAQLATMLRNKPHLEALTLQRCVFDGGWGDTSRWGVPRLRRLHVDDCEDLRPEELLALLRTAPIEDLALELVEPQLEWTDWRCFEALRHLKLAAGSHRWTPQSLPKLAAVCPSLETLAVNFGAINYHHDYANSAPVTSAVLQGLAALAQLPSLRALSLDFGTRTWPTVKTEMAAVLCAIARVEPLRTLRLRATTPLELDGQADWALLAALPRLATLELHGFGELSAQQMAALAQLKHLQCLRLHETRFQAEACCVLSGSCAHLAALEIGCHDELCSTWLHAVARLWPRLERLTITNCRRCPEQNDEFDLLRARGVAVQWADTCEDPDCLERD